MSGLPPQGKKSRARLLRARFARRFVSNLEMDDDNTNASPDSPPPESLVDGIKIQADTSEIRKMFECPVCFDVILPPVILCGSGHAICDFCQSQVTRCPFCRAKFTNIRNLFAENFLDKCLIKCKYGEAGCVVQLPGRDLAEHQKHCPYRPLVCRECDREIPYDQFLDHLRNVEKLEVQRAVECSTGFEIEDEELYHLYLDEGERGGASVWEPTWIHCYGQDFFCFLESWNSTWWIWIGSLAPPDLLKTFVCSILVWNKENQTELKYVGPVHHIRTHPNDVMKTGQCLLFFDFNVKNFMYRGGIDVLVRIDNEYEPPKTKKGAHVESPITLFGSRAAGESGSGWRVNRVNRAVVRPLNLNLTASMNGETLADQYPSPGGSSVSSDVGDDVPSLRHEDVSREDVEEDGF